MWLTGKSLDNKILEKNNRCNKSYSSRWGKYKCHEKPLKEDSLKFNFDTCLYCSYEKYGLTDNLKNELEAYFSQINDGTLLYLKIKVKEWQKIYDGNWEISRISIYFSALSVIMAIFGIIYNDQINQLVGFDAAALLFSICGIVFGVYVVYNSTRKHSKICEIKQGFLAIIEELLLEELANRKI